MNRKRMDTRGEIVGQRLVDHAMTIDPALPFEGIRHNINPEMGFTAGPCAGVARMLVGFINHVEALRGESRGQLLGQEFGGAHVP